MANDELITLLPDNASAFEASHSAIDQRLLAIDTDVIRREREPNSCSAAFVPFLGWERSVHHWTSDEATNRARIASSFDDHGAYGSPDALEDEIRLDVGYDAILVREFWEVPGFVWPDFQVAVKVIPDGPTPPSYADVRAAAIARKNVRDYPGQILFEVDSSGPFGVAAVAGLNGIIHTLPLDPTPHCSGAAFYGARATLLATINSRPL